MHTATDTKEGLLGAKQKFQEEQNETITNRELPKMIQITAKSQGPELKAKQQAKN